VGLFQKLLVYPNIDLKLTSPISLMVAPAACAISMIRIIQTAAASVSVPGNISLGIAAGETDIMPITSLIGLDTAGESRAIWMPGIARLVEIGDTVKLGRGGATATTSTATIELWGEPRL
jgi:hypothetical protein